MCPFPFMAACVQATRLAPRIWRCPASTLAIKSLSLRRARLPQLFRDEGVFDRRAYLRSQGIDLTAELRSSELLERIEPAKPSPRTVLATVRRRLRETLSSMFPDAPEEAAVLRAMLLGNRSFLDRSESVNCRPCTSGRVTCPPGRFQLPAFVPLGVLHCGNCYSVA